MSPDGNIPLVDESLNYQSSGGTLDAEVAVPNPYPAVPWPALSPSLGQTTGDVRDTDLFKVTFNIRLRKA